LLGWNIYIVVVVLGSIASVMIPHSAKTTESTNTTFNAEYTAEYEQTEEKPFANGSCGAAYRVKKKNSDDETIYMGKIFSGNPDLCKATFEPEARVFAAKLEHPNVVMCHKIYGDGKPGDGFIMDLVNGMDMGKAIL
jgi:hypothetical protein